MQCIREFELIINLFSMERTKMGMWKLFMDVDDIFLAYETVIK